MSEQKDLMESKVTDYAGQYYEKYSAQMDLLEGSILSKVKTIDSYDVYALGKQLEQFEEYCGLVMDEADGNQNLLGKLPNVALDVLTVNYATNILGVIAATQPIDEPQGIIYFENVRFNTTKGSHTIGDTATDPRSGVTTPQNYASSEVSDEVVAAATVSATLQYTKTLAQLPVVSQSIQVTMGSITAVDDGNGALLGNGMSGTINYTTGALVVDLIANPGNGQVITVTYQVNFELASSLPEIEQFFDNTPVKAKTYALKGTFGLFQSISMKKRFGLIAEDELAKKLVQQMNAEIGGDAIRKLAAVAVGTTTWDRTPPASVSEWDHRQSFSFAVADAEATLSGNAGRGTISVIIAGRSLASVISTLPGFTRISDGQSLGSHIFGTYNGITIVKVNDTAVLGTNSGLALYKGLGPFEAPVVYSPYMPLMVTPVLPQGTNPLGNQRAAAVWAGVTAPVPNYVTNITMTQSTPA